MPIPALLKIATYAVSGTDSQVVFANIPTSVDGVGIKDLRIVIGNKANEINDAAVQFNGSSSNISGLRLYAFNNSLAGNSYSNGSAMSYITTTDAHIVWELQDFAATDKYKTVLITETDADRGYLAYKIFKWESYSAITSLTITPSSPYLYATGATFDLYGVVG